MYLLHPRTTKLPYIKDSVPWFEKIKRLPWPIFLDSTYSQQTRGSRYDILTADPIKTFLTRGDVTFITQDKEIQTSLENPFLLLKEELKKRSVSENTLPFCGGAMGYFGYDLVNAQRHPGEETSEIPEMAVGIYDWALIVDHHKRATVLVSLKSESEHRSLLDLFAGMGEVSFRCAVQSFTLKAPFQPDFTKAEYKQAFEKVKNYLYAGDCYQVNLAVRFSAVAEGDLWAAYKTLRKAHPAPFSGYFEIPGKITLLSFSPERFIQIQSRVVTTCPIKGTRPRHPDPNWDNQLKKILLNSPKDRAENLMIVDLMRNDLGITCKPGSIKVPKLFEIQSFSAVHHLVSTVTGVLDLHYEPIDVLRTAFPGGSITGAPKARAMEIIGELEPHPRALYTGSLGYLSFDGKLDTNILIRSFVQHQSVLHTWAGGGIVADSVCAEEYQEIQDKIKPLLEEFQGG